MAATTIGRDESGQEGRDPARTVDLGHDVAVRRARPRVTTGSHDGLGDDGSGVRDAAVTASVILGRW